jgi:hypothetical protein
MGVVRFLHHMLTILCEIPDFCSEGFIEALVPTELKVFLPNKRSVYQAQITIGVNCHVILTEMFFLCKNT